MTEAEVSTVWLGWIRRLRALAQNGLTYAENPFDQERYRDLSDLTAEIAARHAELDAETVRGLFAQELGPATPKVDVRGAVFRDDTILLVREREDDRWTLPGGWIDVEESPSEAVVREIVEESGYRTEAVKLLALWDKNRHRHPPSPYHVYKLVFRCRLVGGAPATSIETSGAAFFPASGLPELSRTRITAEQIERLFAHRQNPDWPTDFD